ATALVLAFLHFVPKPLTSAAEPMRFQIPLPEQVNSLDESDVPIPAVSPDGRWLAFQATNSDGSYHLWIRELNSLEARLLPAEVDDLSEPFWSPDSRYLGFSGGGKLRKIDISNGVVQTLSDTQTAPGLTGSWNHDGVIIQASITGSEGVVRLSPNGANIPITRPNSLRKEIFHWSPRFLADGKRFLYANFSSVAENNGIYLGAIDRVPEQQARERLVAADVKFGFAYLPAQSGIGQILFERAGVLLAQSFNEKTLTLSGEPGPVAKIGAANFSASD